VELSNIQAGKADSADQLILFECKTISDRNLNMTPHTNSMVISLRDHIESAA
jgi:hypothetical protein